MVTAKATKAADKSQVCRKLVQSLQKQYGKSVPKIELPVVETFLFAACLEDNPWPQAEEGYRKLMSSFFDLNEIRVSSVSELEQNLSPLRDADWKGLRIRSILRYVFESTYSYDFEKLRRQTQEQALKLLKKVNDITPFIRDYVLQEILGSHVVVLDTSMLNAARWLGLVPWTADIQEASEFLKGGLKKSEVAEFCHLLRCLSTDPKYIPRFADPPDSELSMDDVADRFVELQSPPKKKVAKPAPEPPKAAAKKQSEKIPEKAAEKSSEKKSAAKTASTKAAAPTNSPSTKKSESTKSTPTKPTAGKSKATSTKASAKSNAKPAAAKAQASKSVATSKTGAKARKPATATATKASSKPKDKKITTKPKVAAKVAGKKAKR